MPERDYKAEYAKFHSSGKAKGDRASRNKARRLAELIGKARKGDGKDVDHRNGNPRDNRPSNLRMLSPSANRAKK